MAFHPGSPMTPSPYVQGDRMTIPQGGDRSGSWQGYHNSLPAPPGYQATGAHVSMVMAPAESSDDDGGSV